MRIIAALLLTGWMASTAQAEVKRVVVLPPARATPDVFVTFEELDDFEDALRATTKKLLDQEEHAVVTREKMLAAFSKLAGNRHLDCGASCVVQVAQLLPAELYLTSRVTQQNDRFIAFVQLFNPSGQSLASAVLESVRVRNLPTQFAAKGEALYALKLKEQSPIHEVVSEYTSQNGLQLHFDAGLAPGRWTLFNGRGKALCELPCTRWVGALNRYTLKSAVDERVVEVPDLFGYEWGKAMNARVMAPSSNFMLSPWWMLITIPGIIGASSFGLVGLGFTLFYDFYTTTDRLMSGALTLGFLAVATAFTVWTVKIAQNLRKDGLQLEPVESPLQAMLRERSAWASVTPQARPDGR
jgi:hypothetical protein